VDSGPWLTQTLVFPSTGFTQLAGVPPGACAIGLESVLPPAPTWTATGVSIGCVVDVGEDVDVGAGLLIPGGFPIAANPGSVDVSISAAVQKAENNVTLFV